MSSPNIIRMFKNESEHPDPKPPLPELVFLKSKKSFKFGILWLFLSRSKIFLYFVPIAVLQAEEFSCFVHSANDTTAIELNVQLGDECKGL